jgi:formamidopyrimidine-DNA glycosylase
VDGRDALPPTRARYLACPILLPAYRGLAAMPELPEVEHGTRVFRKAALERTIAAVQVLHPSYARTLPAADVDRLVGRSVVGVERRGKHQLATLDDGAVLETHFRMTGEWRVSRRGDSFERYARLVIDFTDGTRITLADPRALGSARLHRDGAVALPPLGPDPLTTAFSADALAAALAHRRGPIKAALLDQRVVAGLGNIYAAEALWLARIDPRARASSLNGARLGELVRAIRAVLRRAPAARYTQRVRRRHSWRVYDREGEQCRRCRGQIRRIVQSARSTYYCPSCQSVGQRSVG